MPAPSTPVEVILHLSSLTRELDRLTQAYCAAERDMVAAKSAADLAEARAYLAATGTVDARNSAVTEVTAAVRQAADVAESVVRQLKRQIATLEIRIDVGRTYAASVRAELRSLGLTEETMT